MERRKRNRGQLIQGSLPNWVTGCVGMGRQQRERWWQGKWWESTSCQRNSSLLSDEVHDLFSTEPSNACSFHQYCSLKSTLSLLQHDFAQTFHCVENLGQALHCIAIFKDQAAFSIPCQLSKSTWKKEKNMKLYVMLQRQWAPFQIQRK